MKLILWDIKLLGDLWRSSLRFLIDIQIVMVQPWEELDLPSPPLLLKGSNFHSFVSYNTSIHYGLVINIHNARTIWFIECGQPLNFHSPMWQANGEAQWGGKSTILWEWKRACLKLNLSRTEFPWLKKVSFCRMLDFSSDLNPSRRRFSFLTPG